MSDKKTDEGLLKTWAESQQKLLTDWLETLRRLGGTPTLELWTKTVDAWQSSVKETLFNIVREINFRPEPGAGAQAGRDLVQLWQDSAHKMIDAQATLARRWSERISGTRKQDQSHRS